MFYSTLFSNLEALPDQWTIDFFSDPKNYWNSLKVPYRKEISPVFQPVLKFTREKIVFQDIHSILWEQRSLFPLQLTVNHLRINLSLHVVHSFCKTLFGSLPNFNFFVIVYRYRNIGVTFVFSKIYCPILNLGSFLFQTRILNTTVRNEEVGIISVNNDVLGQLVSLVLYCWPLWENLFYDKT